MVKQIIWLGDYKPNLPKDALQALAPPNLRHEIAPPASMARFIATRFIGAREDLTVNYDVEAAQAPVENTWANHKQIKPIVDWAHVCCFES